MKVTEEGKEGCGRCVNQSRSYKMLLWCFDYPEATHLSCCFLFLNYPIFCHHAFDSLHILSINSRIIFSIFSLFTNLFIHFISISFMNASLHLFHFNKPIGLSYLSFRLFISSHIYMYYSLYICNKRTCTYCTDDLILNTVLLALFSFQFEMP